MFANTYIHNVFKANNPFYKFACSFFYINFPRNSISLLSYWEYTQSHCSILWLKWEQKLLPTFSIYLLYSNIFMFLRLMGNGIQESRILEKYAFRIFAYNIYRILIELENFLVYKERQTIYYLNSYDRQSKLCTKTIKFQRSRMKSFLCHLVTC